MRKKKKKNGKSIFNHFLEFSINKATIRYTNIYKHHIITKFSEYINKVTIMISYNLFF